MEDWVTIKNLKAKKPEISNREIARQLGVSHNTVKLALERTDSPKYNSSGRVSSLEPLKDEILRMLNVMKLNGSRIYNELCSKGYTGGRATFYDFLAKIKPSEPKCFTPYETSPDDQA